MGHLLSLKEAGERLGVSHDTVNRLVRQGALRVADVSAGAQRARLRISEDELARFIESRTYSAPEQDSDSLLDAARPMPAEATG